MKIFALIALVGTTAALRLQHYNVKSLIELNQAPLSPNEIEEVKKWAKDEVTNENGDKTITKQEL